MRDRTGTAHRVGQDPRLGDPLSLLNHIEFVATMVRADLCEFCKPEWHLMPMHGTAWGAEVQHAEDCPVTLELEL